MEMARLPKYGPRDRGSGTYYITPAVADTYAAPVFGLTPSVYSKAPVKTENPAVLDALLKITDYRPGYGYNMDNWRRWWASEKKNRDLKNPAAAHKDRVLSKDGLPPG
jgi:hypothetical protein